MSTELLQRIHDRRARTVVLGQGYVGLVVAVRATEAGFPVIGLEIDEQRCTMLRQGRSYIEDVTDRDLDAALASGYTPTSDPGDLAGFEVAVISVPTPLQEGAPDLSHIESAAAMLGPHLRRGALVILESTTYPGTTEELVAPVLEHTSGLTPGADFLLGYSPERIDPGNPVFGLHNTPKVVAGVDRLSLAAVEAFFGTFVEKTVAVSGCGEAELAKVIENTFRHVNIALVNELAMFANALGIDVNEAIDAASTKPFGFMTFRPGPGVGGHCLPIDPSYLSWRVKTTLGDSFRFIELANDINDHMPHYIVRRATASLNVDRKAVNGSHIVVLGVTYKPNVGDSRESPALAVVTQLVSLGAKLTVVDPHVNDPGSFAETTLRQCLDDELLADSDLVVILTDHDEFDYDRVAALAPRVLDTRNRLAVNSVNVERL